MKRRMALLCMLAALVLPACETTTGPAPAPLLVFPLDAALGAEVYLGLLFDHGSRENPTAAEPPQSLSDYSCGTRTVAGHSGTDFVIPSFVAMETGVPVLAAAPGRVKEVQDGHYDRHLFRSPGDPGNHVVVEHAGGYVTVYQQLRLGSVAVVPGQRVSTGETLGMVGSSGGSYWPHLHFEVRAPGGTAVDPWSGGCHAMRSLWMDQPPGPSGFETIASGVTADPITPPVIAGPPAPLEEVVASDVRVTVWVHVINHPEKVISVRVLRSDSSVHDTADLPLTGAFPPNKVYLFEFAVADTSALGRWVFEFLVGGTVFDRVPLDIVSAQEVRASPPSDS